MTKAYVISADDLNNLIHQSIRSALSEQSENTTGKDRFLTIAEASEYLNLAKQTIYGLTSTRGIPFMKRGKKLYFRRTELETWVLEGKKKTVKEIEREV